jgi:hypothetical protein
MTQYLLGDLKLRWNGSNPTSIVTKRLQFVYISPVSYYFIPPIKRDLVKSLVGDFYNCK